MIELLKNPIILGGIIPMILFGFFNFFWKNVSQNLSLSEIMLALGLSAFLIAFFLCIFTSSEGEIKNVFHSFYFWKAVGVGLLWACSIILISYAFGFLNGEISHIIPIINANTFVAILLGVFFAGEELTWQIIVGSFMIVGGTIIIMIK